MVKVKEIIGDEEKIFKKWTRDYGGIWNINDTNLFRKILDTEIEKFYFDFNKVKNDVSVGTVFENSVGIFSLLIAIISLGAITSSKISILFFSFLMLLIVVIYALILRNYCKVNTKSVYSYVDFLLKQNGYLYSPYKVNFRVYKKRVRRK